MRILFCNYEYPPLGGGGGVVNALLAEEVATRHEVTVLTSQSTGLAAASVENGVQVVRVPVLFRRQQSAANLPSMLAYMVQGVLGGRRLLRAAGFDLINTHFVLPSGPVGDGLARLIGRPNVLSLHGGDLYDPTKWSSPHRHASLRAWVRRLLRRADHLVAQSTDTVANLHQIYAPDLPVTRIPHGIRRPPAAQGRRADYGFAVNDLLLVTVGRLVLRKAVDELIGFLPAAPPQTHLLIVGDGPQALPLRRQASALGLRTRVHFFGRLSEDEKFRILHLADLFVSTSQHEGFGLVFLEAMACGLPVVCYDCGGQTDFLESGTTGAVVPLNDRDGFARQLQALLDQPGLRASIGAENRQRAEAYYIDSCARRYETVFEEVVALHRERPRSGNSSSSQDDTSNCTRSSRSLWG
jgi:L-malate glycosyltransferase